MDAWAQKTEGHPVSCRVCGRTIPVREQFYYVTQLDRDESGNEQPVCYLHCGGGKVHAEYTTF